MIAGIEAAVSVVFNSKIALVQDCTTAGDKTDGDVENRWLRWHLHDSINIG